MKFSLQSYTALYNRITSMVGVLKSIDKPTDAQKEHLKGLQNIADDLYRAMSVLGEDLFLKRIS